MDSQVDGSPRRRLAPFAAQRHVARQQEYRGGWPLGYMGAECPAHSSSKCTVRYGFDNLNCCPNGQTCQDDILTIYCCPTGKQSSQPSPLPNKRDIRDRFTKKRLTSMAEADCRAAVANRPVCANSTWDLYGLSKDKYFCCPTGYFGVLPISGGAGLCEPNVVGIPASRIASIFTVPTGASAGGGGGGGASNPQPTAGNSGAGAGAGSGSGSSSEGGNAGAGGSGGSAVSAGAIAGIVMGGIILLAIVVSVILWYHRRSLRKIPPSKPEQPPDWGVDASAQHQAAMVVSPAATPMPPPQYTPAPNQPEAGGTQIVEMPATRA